MATPRPGSVERGRGTRADRLCAARHGPMADCEGRLRTRSPGAERTPSVSSSLLTDVPPALAPQWVRPGRVGPTGRPYGLAVQIRNELRRWRARGLDVRDRSRSRRAPHDEHDHSQCQRQEHCGDGERRRDTLGQAVNGLSLSRGRGCRVVRRALARGGKYGDEDREAQRTADLTRDVDETRRGAGVTRRDTGDPAPVSGIMATPAPTPRSIIGTAICGKYCVSIEIRLTHAIPIRAMMRPAIISRMLPTRGAIRGTTCTIPNIATVIGRNASPAASGLKPSAPCRYWVRKKNIPNMPLTSRTRAMYAPERSRLTNSRSGVMGCSARTSVKTKAASRAAPPRRLRSSRGRPSRLRQPARSRTRGWSSRGWTSRPR